MSVIFSREGAQALRLAWVTLLVGLAVAGGIAWGTHLYSESEAKSLASSSQQLRQAEGRLALARRERDDLATSLETYQQLAARGALRPEARLELVEWLATLKSSHRLSRLDYDVEPQRKVAVTGVPADALDLAASRVRVTLQALHEADALAFLRDLANPPSGFLPASDCTVRTLDAQSTGARVEAACTFEWLTVRDKRGSRAG